MPKLGRLVVVLARDEYTRTLDQKKRPKKYIAMTERALKMLGLSEVDLSEYEIVTANNVVRLFRSPGRGSAHYRALLRKKAQNIKVTDITGSSNSSDGTVDATGKGTSCQFSAPGLSIKEVITLLKIGDKCRGVTSPKGVFYPIKPKQTQGTGSGGSGGQLPGSGGGGGQLPGGGGGN